jgi:hypothetical protein
MHERKKHRQVTLSSHKKRPRTLGKIAPQILWLGRLPHEKFGLSQSRMNRDTLPCIPNYLGEKNQVSPNALDAPCIIEQEVFRLFAAVRPI